ncbi:MAG: hypothetical protein U1E65_20275 [Myxococcota bacterium]
MSPRWLLAPLASAWGLGCQSIEVLPPPPAAASGSTLLVWIEGDAVRRVISSDAASMSVDLGAFSRDTTGDAAKSFALVQLSYGCPLADLGLSAGSIALNQEKLTPALELPKPTAMHQLDLGAGARTWTDASERSDVLDKLRGLPLEPEALCARLGANLEPADRPEIQLLQLPLLYEQMYFDTMTPLGDGSALASFALASTPTQTQQLKITAIGAEAATLRYRSRGREEALPSGRLALGTDRSLWFVSQTGSVAHGSFEGGVDVVGHLEWRGTKSSSVPGHLTNVWSLAIGGKERLFAGYVHNDGRYLEQAEGAVLSFVEGEAPVVVDALDGFASPSVAASPNGGVLIAGLGMNVGHLREASLGSGGQWTVRELLFPAKPTSFGEDNAVPTQVSALPGGRIRVAVSALSIKLAAAFNILYTNVPTSAFMEGTPDQLAWLDQSLGPGGVATDVLELSGGLIAQVMITQELGSLVSLYQRGVRTCGSVYFHQVEGAGHEEGADAETFDRHRAYIAPLGEDSFAILPTHTDVHGFLFRRPRRAPACLELP